MREIINWCGGGHTWAQSGVCVCRCVFALTIKRLFDVLPIDGATQAKEIAVERCVFECGGTIYHRLHTDWEWRARDPQRTSWTKLFDFQQTDGWSQQRSGHNLASTLLAYQSCLIGNISFGSVRFAGTNTRSTCASSSYDLYVYVIVIWNAAAAAAAAHCGNQCVFVVPN